LFYWKSFEDGGEILRMYEATLEDIELLAVVENELEALRESDRDTKEKDA
jgi:hypothetical protein